MSFKLFKRFISFALCFVLLFTCSVYTQERFVYAEDALEELRNAASAINEKIAANQQKLQELKSDKSQQEAYLETLKQNITYTQNQLDNLNSQISEIEKQITAVENTVASLQKEVDKIQTDIETTDTQINDAEKTVKKTYKSISARLRSAYISGNDTTLKLLLGADNIASLLRRLQFMKTVSENDAKLINDLKAEAQVLELCKDSLNERKTLLAEKKQEVEDNNKSLYEKRSELKSKKSSLEASNASLEEQYKEVETVISNLDKNSTYYNNLIAQQQKEAEENEALIQKLLAERGSQTNGNTQSNASYMYPIQMSGSYISSGYGYRDASISGNAFHGGIDITGGSIYGQNIYASRAGTVIVAEKNSDRGYGHYVIIDHGDGYATLYGHCSTVLVSEGQQVAQGAVIALVGSTGNSTGPHLHFEIRRNGEKQNPMNYF